MPSRVSFGFASPVSPLFRFSIHRRRVTSFDGGVVFFFRIDSREVHDYSMCKWEQNEAVKNKREWVWRVNEWKKHGEIRVGGKRDRNEREFNTVIILKSGLNILSNEIWGWGSNKQRNCGLVRFAKLYYLFLITLKLSVLFNFRTLDDFEGRKKRRLFHVSTYYRICNIVKLNLPIFIGKM